MKTEKKTDDATHAATVSKHVAVWLDHKEARVIEFHPDSAGEATVSAPPHNDHHKHTRGQEGLKEHPEDAKRFYHDLVGALQGTEELLIVGPGAAKLEFSRYLHTHDAPLEAKVVGIETVDHPSDAQLAAYAKTYFKGADRMR
jgi:stalled ribosome rescue protein Dom34